MRKRRLRWVLLVIGLGSAACSDPQVGDACEVHEDCEAFGGYCAHVRVCTRTCAESTKPCPEGAVCRSVGAMRMACLSACTTTCPEGQRCTNGACWVIDPLEPPMTEP